LVPGLRNQVGGEAGPRGVGSWLGSQVAGEATPLGVRSPTGKQVAGEATPLGVLSPTGKQVAGEAGPLGALSPTGKQVAGEPAPLGVLSWRAGDPKGSQPLAGTPRKAEGPTAEPEAGFAGPLAQAERSEARRGWWTLPEANGRATGSAAHRSGLLNPSRDAVSARPYSQRFMAFTTG